MSRETALLESRTLRRSLCERVDVLDKVKALVLLPDGLHVTTRMVADYFEVGEKAINTLLQRHRAELGANGFTVVHRVEPGREQDFNLKSWLVGGRGLALWPRRAVLNVAMLLRDSEVARSVRRHLLDAEERPASGYLDHTRLLAAAERRVLDGEVGERLVACERMVLADRALVRAMSARLCEAAHDLRELRADVAEIRSALAVLTALGGGGRERRRGRGR
jgi:hypothetical protein